LFSFLSLFHHRLFASLFSQSLSGHPLIEKEPSTHGALVERVRAQYQTRAAEEIAAIEEKLSALNISIDRFVRDTAARVGHAVKEEAGTGSLHSIVTLRRVCIPCTYDNAITMIRCNGVFLSFKQHGDGRNTLAKQSIRSQSNEENQSP
jgi:HPt (histidine-containing phosphotransfer) domain-containing protein